MKRPSLLDRAESLADQSASLVAQAVIEYPTDPARANALLADAKELVVEARALIERHRRRERRKVLGMQFVVGVGSAWMVFLNLDNGNYLLAALSLVCVLLTANWKILA
jgi:hypothetical protein